MRYRKIVKTDGGETSRYDYVYSEGSLILITFTADGVSDTARFIYDSYGEPRGFILNDTAAYLYIKNAQGDITGIVNENGEIILTCSYDAWGRVNFGSTSMTHMTLAAKLSQINPFTYRGYCYDYDIGMYYLQSRYYDPTICRFINADSTDYLGATGTLLSYNLFAYCENDGVNFVDEKGTWGEDVHRGFYLTNKKSGISLKKYDTVYVPYVKKRGFYGTYFWARKIGFSISQAMGLADSSYAIDEKYPAWIPTRANQSWHFNTWEGGGDSRKFLSATCIAISLTYFEEAKKFYDENRIKQARTNLTQGILYLGYSLHPIQDIYAHTDKVSKWKVIAGVGYWSHLDTKDVDTVIKHKDAVFVTTANQTKRILRTVYQKYKILFDNIDIYYNLLN